MAMLEIEYKNLLTSSEFHKLAQHFTVNTRFEQTNYYYDTIDYQLKKIHCGLRIRCFSDHAEQTLKVPATDTTAKYRQLTEITDSLTKVQANLLVSTQGLYLDGQVGAELVRRHVTLTQLRLIAQGHTIRQISFTASGKLTLDQTCYPNGTKDYELELETTQPELAQQSFTELLTTFKIPQRPVVNKVMRAISQL